MTYHIVLFKFKKKTDSAYVTKMAGKLSKLTERIPGIVEFTWGTSVSKEQLEKNFTHGFIMIFKNQQYRNRYLSHPLHQEWVKGYLNPVRDEVLVFDIEKVDSKSILK